VQIQALHSKPCSSGSALGLDADDAEIVGGREPILVPKLLDDDEVIVRFTVNLNLHRTLFVAFQS
jgi:hypothetical protein